MERCYCVTLKQPRCGERFVFVNDLELVVLIHKNQLVEECELILEPGYVIKTDITTCYKAIISATDTEVWRKCGEEPTGLAPDQEE